MKKLSLRLIFIFAATSFVIACASKKVAPVTGSLGQPKVVVPTASPIEVSKGLVARAITSLGDNRAPRFSSDGNKLLFVSSARPSHRQAQVYELDLLRATERRVTFHDGDDEGASWVGLTKIAYSSVTDEMKENISLDRLKQVYESSKSANDNPNGIRPAPKVINGGEIYMQRLDGRDIVRITDSAGPDRSPTSDGKRIVFVSSRAGDPKLYLWSGGSVRAVSHGPDFTPAFSPDGRTLVWQRLVPQADPKAPQQFQLMMSENLREAVPLTSPGFVDQQPQWTAKGDGVVFSSNRGNGKSFDLYMIDRKASCLKRLTEVQDDLTWPATSPDGSKIAFVSKANGQNEIYTMEDRSVALPCVTAPPTKP
jgi:Tol biopolymer transport system component